MFYWRVSLIPASGSININNVKIRCYDGGAVGLNAVREVYSPSFITLAFGTSPTQELAYTGCFPYTCTASATITCELLPYFTGVVLNHSNFTVAIMKIA
jgi:hypothetical protein